MSNENMTNIISNNTINLIEEIKSEKTYKIMGPDSLQHKIRVILDKYSHIFSTEVREQPADIPALEVEVDVHQWETSSNSGPPRILSASKQLAVQDMITKLLKLKVIRASQEPYYSQITLVPKMDESWRMCVDFRRLNRISKSLGWPLPNIQEMLRRIGQHKPKYFATIDLTSGYHQMPMRASSIRFTAFITFMGIFEWLRVPMGLKGAASYFQQAMAHIVLIGLLYVSLEVYLDDIIIHAQTEDHFITRLQEVFERLTKHNITLNPAKCVFGAEEIQYVGHIINSQGTTFAREKLDEVINYRDLIVQQDLKSFMGLANYLSTHVKDFAKIARPLHKLITPYKPRRHIKWTEETYEALSELKKAIGNCAVLFFIDENSPVYLKTDASEYGIGAYLYQIKDGMEYPIGFLCKSLHDEQLSWSVPEKECYAIILAVRKFEYLLRHSIHLIY